jgi:hypothetical protein
MVDLSSSGEITRFEDSSTEDFPKLTGFTSNIELPFLPTVTWPPCFRPWSLIQSFGNDTNKKNSVYRKIILHCIITKRLD